jgi:hypothetical protein
MPSFFMRLRNVLGCMLKTLAAPCGANRESWLHARQYDQCAVCLETFNGPHTVPGIPIDFSALPQKPH